MDKFNGFSQDEINKVSGAKNKKTTTGSSANPTMKQAFRGQHGGIRRMPDKWSRPTTTSSTETFRKQQVNSGRSSAATTMATSDAGATNSKSKIPLAPAIDVVSEEETMEDVILDRSMSKSIEEALFYQPMKPPTVVEKKVVAAAHINGDTSANETNNSSILEMPSLSMPQMDSHVTSTSMDDSSILPSVQRQAATGGGDNDVLNVDSPFKGISLKDFEAHRKMIQEQNKQKKELLYKAIEHHSQKTAAETRKIQEIKSELTKLDNDLALDVAILRKQIDNACIHFASVEKQYMKIEAQFLKIKIDLHNAAEKKELLTEHLCTVIAHNEDSKAEKLSELMEKVGLTPTGEYAVDK